MPAITDALKAVRLAEQMKKTILGAIVTRVNRDKIELEPEIVREMLEVPILGMIPEDIAVKKSIRNKGAVVQMHPKSAASRAYKEIAAKILNVPYDSKKDRENLMRRMLKTMGFID